MTWRNRVIGRKRPIDDVIDLTKGDEEDLPGWHVGFTVEVWSYTQITRDPVQWDIGKFAEAYAEGLRMAELSLDWMHARVGGRYTSYIKNRAYEYATCCVTPPDDPPYMSPPGSPRSPAYWPSDSDSDVESD